MATIFISYSRKDEAFVRKLATDLERLGADLWLDIEDIPVGMKWSSAIQEGLDRATAMLVILSPDSMASQNVEDEWQYFVDQRRPIIPILARPAKIHFQLSRLQYLDFSGGKYPLAALVQELARHGAILNKPDLPGKIEVSSPPATPVKISSGLLVLLALIVLIGIAITVGPRLLFRTPTPTVIPFTLDSPQENRQVGNQMLCVDGTASPTAQEVVIHLTRDGVDEPIATGSATISARGRWKAMLRVEPQQPTGGSLVVFLYQNNAVSEKLTRALTLSDRYLPAARPLGPAQAATEDECSFDDDQPLSQ